MACESTKYVGRDVVLEYAIGCGDTKPLSSEWKVFGALRTKNFSLTWDTTDATADDSVGALRENLATFQNLEISGDGVCKASGAGSANLIELTKHVANPVATSGQPVVWMRMTFPDLTFVAFMLISDLSRAAPHDDVVTYSLTAAATASDFGLTVTDTIVAPTTLVIAPDPATITVDGGTLQLTLTATPSGASTAVTWASGTPATATVDSAGLVTAVADGTSVITATSTVDPLITDTVTVTVSNQIP